MGAPQTPDRKALDRMIDAHKKLQARRTESAAPAGAADPESAPAAPQQQGR